MGLSKVTLEASIALVRPENTYSPASCRSRPYQMALRSGVTYSSQCRTKVESYSTPVECLFGSSSGLKRIPLGAVLPDTAIAILFSSSWRTFRFAIGAETVPASCTLPISLAFPTTNFVSPFSPSLSQRISSAVPSQFGSLALLSLVIKVD